MNTPKAQIEGGGVGGLAVGTAHDKGKALGSHATPERCVRMCRQDWEGWGQAHSTRGVTQAITYEILAASDTRVINTGKDCRRGEAARSLAAEGSRM